MPSDAVTAGDAECVFFASGTKEPGAPEALEAGDPANPFCTAAYARAMERLGYRAWVLGMRRGDTIVAASLALSKQSRLFRSLEIPSLSQAAADERFWSGLKAFCRREKITDLALNTFHSPEIAIPPLPGETERRARQEYWVDLGKDFAAAFSSNHKRNAKKARTAGVTARHTNELSAIADHLRLMEASETRRQNRGKNISLQLDPAEYRAYLETESAELHQAIHNNSVLSSVLVLKSTECGYYHSAGTTPEGMSLGASHFLIASICETFQRNGRTAFNLGGAEEGSSLARFKSGFGASARPLAAVRCYIGPVWKKKLRSAAGLAKADRSRFLRALTGRIDRYVLYAADPGALPSTLRLPRAEFRLLSESDLGAINDPVFRQKQLDRLFETGSSSAFGVFGEGRLGHVSGLFPPEIANREASGLLRLKEAEAEITGCETLPEFRGRGLYPFAVQQICSLAAQQGLRRVYMKTRADNRSSRAGIEKAGLKRVRTLVHITLPGFPSKRWLLRLP